MPLVDAFAQMKFLCCVYQFLVIEQYQGHQGSVHLYIYVVPDILRMVRMNSVKSMLLGMSALKWEIALRLFSVN